VTPRVARAVVWRSGWRWRGAILVLAVLPVLALVVLTGLGARLDLGFLSGTSTARAELGLAYALAWFSSVVVSPILLLALAVDRAFTLVGSWSGWRASVRSLGDSGASRAERR
jgi:hypothetical protein